MKLLDSHCHLASLDMDLSLAFAHAKETGIGAIVNIATTPKELEFGLSLVADFPIFHALATTPHDVAIQGEEHFERVVKMTDHLTAIGETGLDYFYMHSPKELQQTFLRKYLQLAHATGLPILFHCRDAFEDLFRIVDEEGYQQPALVHCFTGTLEEANEVIKRGWFLSMSGIVTFKKSEWLRQVAREVPVDRLLIETDAPYLAPGIYRGKQNEPAFLIETAKCIAALRGITLEELSLATWENACRFFHLSL